MITVKEDCPTVITDKPLAVYRSPRDKEGAMKITVANTKGGTAKTTSAVMIATVLAKAGHAVELWDADPQGSASTWAEIAEENDSELPFRTIAVNARTVKKSTPTGVDTVIVDTNPHTPDIVQAAVDTSDHVLVPTTPSPLDLDRTWMTLDVCGDKNVHVLMTVVEPRTIAYRQAVAALDEEHAPRLNAYIPKATAIKDETVRTPERFYGYDDVVAELGLLNND